MKGKLGRGAISRRAGISVAAGVALALPALMIVLTNAPDKEPAAPAAPAQPKSPGRGTQAEMVPREMPSILFSALERGTYRLFGTQPRGRRIVPVLDRRALFPSWSPDGRRVAFVTEAQGFTRTRLAIAAIEPDASVREIQSGPQVPSHPAFDHPDRSIVYQSTLETQSGTAGALGFATIDVVPAAGGQRRTILDSGGATYQPAVSPHGRLAVIVGEARCRAKSCPQRLIVLSDGGRRNVLIPKGVAGAPAWSPDGRRLAFTWERNGGAGIWTIDVSSGRLTQVTSGRPPDTEPTWSPDGDSLAFSRECDIFVQALGGGPARNLTRSKSCEISPTWRPR